MNRYWFTFFVLFLVIAQETCFAKNQVAWVDDIATATQMAAARNQLILIHFTADWCGPCQRLEKKVFSQESFGFAVNQGFVPVKVNVSHHPEIAAKFGVTAWPTDLLMTPEGKELHRMVSPQSMDTYVATLRQVSWRHANSAGMPQYTNSGLPPQNQQMPSSQISGALANQLAERFGGRQNLEMQQAQFMQPQPAQNGPATSNFAAQQTNLSPQANGVGTAPAGGHFQPSYGGEATGTNLPGNLASNMPPRGNSPNFGTDSPSTFDPGSSGTSPHSVPDSAYRNATDFVATNATERVRSEPVAHMINNSFVTPTAATTPLNSPSTNRTSAISPPQRSVVNPRTDQGDKTTFASANPGTASQINAAEMDAPGQAVTMASATSQATTRTRVDDSLGSHAANSPADSTIRLGLDGYCPVSLLQDEQWTAGDKRWGAKHRGCVYLFKSAAAQQIFLANPDRYSPMLAGYDPVLFCDRAEYVTGHRAHGIRYKETVILFSSEDTLEAFSANPEQYVSRVQQLLSGGPQVR